MSVSLPHGEHTKVNAVAELRPGNLCLRALVDTEFSYSTAHEMRQHSPQPAQQPHFLVRARLNVTSFYKDTDVALGKCIRKNVFLQHSLYISLENRTEIHERASIGAYPHPAPPPNLPAISAFQQTPSSHLRGLLRLLSGGNNSFVCP